MKPVHSPPCSDRASLSDHGDPPVPARALGRHGHNDWWAQASALAGDKRAVLARPRPAGQPSDLKATSRIGCRYLGPQGRQPYRLLVTKRFHSTLRLGAEPPRLSSSQPQVYSETQKPERHGGKLSPGRGPRAGRSPGPRPPRRWPGFTTELPT